MPKPATVNDLIDLFARMCSGREPVRAAKRGNVSIRIDEDGAPSLYSYECKLLTFADRTVSGRPMIEAHHITRRSVTTVRHVNRACYKLNACNARFI